MLPVVHPEVLAPEFVPPVLLYRHREVERLVADLGDAPGPKVGLVLGPTGSGSSAVARQAARRIVEELRRRGPETSHALLACVRLRWTRGAQGVAEGLVQHLDPGFHAEGFPTNEIMAGFLRRLRRDRRPAVVVLDDVGRSAPELSGILRAFAHPDRFLPEGVDDAPPLSLLLAGVPEAVAAWRQVERIGLATGVRIELAPYARDQVEGIVRDRLERALGREAPPAIARAISDRTELDGGGATRALELLRRRLLGSTTSADRSGVLAAAPPIAVEPHFIEAIERAASGAAASLGSVRAWEARLAQRDGRRPLPLTTMWRRLLRLESMGLVRRTVRTGGPGGTRSTLELLTPVREWPSPPAPRGSRPAAATGASPMS